MKVRAVRSVVCVSVLMVTWAAAPAFASAPGPAEEDAAALAKKLSNPIADLVSVPFQFNWAQGVGPDEQTRLILNVQPVMPFTLSQDWNLIARVIVPIVGQPPLSIGGQAASGISDVLASFFFSPTRLHKFILGVGPVVSLPSTSEPTLGSGKWSAGPTIVVLKQTGPWTIGALWNQVWSFSGSDSRQDVSQMFLQPFLAYQANKTITLSVNSESSANWKADSDKWTVPINVLVAKLSSFGMFPASYQVGVGAYVAGPENGPDWQLRSSVTILLPRKK